MAKKLSVTPPEQNRLAGQTVAGADRPAISGFSISKKRLALAFAIAGISDAIGVFVMAWPPVVWFVDLMTVVLLFAVLGWHWLLLPGLILEAIPGVEVFPFWVLVVAAIAVMGTARPKLK